MIVRLASRREHSFGLPVVRVIVPHRLLANYSAELRTCPTQIADSCRRDFVGGIGMDRRGPKAATFGRHYLIGHRARADVLFFADGTLAIDVEIAVWRRHKGDRGAASSFRLALGRCNARARGRPAQTCNRITAEFSALHYAALKPAGVAVELVSV